MSDSNIFSLLKLLNNNKFMNEKIPSFSSTIIF